MTYSTTSENFRRATCRQIRDLAVDLIEGRRGAIETARVILPLAFSINAEAEPEFLVFRGIASETDDLPIGDARDHWETHALEREDVQIEAAEKIWSEQARDAARALLERYR